MSTSHYNLSAYNFDLDPQLIAQGPVEPRDHCKLMVIDRKSQTITHTYFYEIHKWISKGDHLVVNDSKVIPARLFGKKATGALIECLLLENIQESDRNYWTAMIKPAKKVPIGHKIYFSGNVVGQVDAILEDGIRAISFYHNDQLLIGDAFFALLNQYGHIPLPPYIQREDDQKDAQDYQTVYANPEGSVAAPTAGLHFTQELLDTLFEKGVGLSKVTLHVGMGTFKPMQTEDIRQHPIHTERFYISEKTCREVEAVELANKVIAVGTTSCRVLESASYDFKKIKAGSGKTNLFIYPNYQFKTTQALLTNFHLPQSSLLVLVAAFMGYDLMKKAYEEAILNRYRFFSYGDAMLIL